MWARRALNGTKRRFPARAVNGKAVASGKASDAIALLSGGNTNIVVAVTAQDGKKTTVYRIVAARGSPSLGRAA